MSKTGRPKLLGPDKHELLLEIVASNPLATLDEITALVSERLGRTVHPATVRRSLREAGVKREHALVKPAERPKTQRYGYTEARRSQAPEQLYPSCLTDVEGELVADLFEKPGGQGLPPTHSRRAIVDACCYVVRTSCSWRMLPKEFPHWDNVYKSFRRWSKAGKFEAMHDRLREQWREREGRAATPSSAVLDAQSTRSSGKLPDLSAAQFPGTAGNLFGLQCVKAAFSISSQPFVDSGPAHAKRFDDDFRALANNDSLNGANANGF
ncbi:transposase [Tamilnaduibacter salinus]|uniref:Transposase n=1 Tax=Tamilnaduibacter salinus TaxID=1484056 RepID=A0A2A2I0E7_9GAMM|nr:hypothetical protein CF392_13855 [Tamilnaduibacter salinus]PVY79065.1 transposase [Tamilnaduibacter salinus]